MVINVVICQARVSLNINAYLFTAVAVTSVFSRYLLIVVLVIYSLLKMAVKKGHAVSGSGPKPAVYLY